MWVSRYLSAPRVTFRRIILLLATILTVAVFAVIPLSQPAYAADATWEGGSIRFNSQLYSPESSADPPAPVATGDPRGMAGRIAYTWIETTPGGSQRAHVIYLDDGFNPVEDNTASLIRYDYSPPDAYTNPSSPRDITIGANLVADSGGETAASECGGFGSIGWFLCPVSRWLADGVDFAYGLMREFLEVPIITADTESSLYTVWGIVRSVANVALIIVILTIVYSQVTNIGISNYGIKYMLPRLIIAGILANISFWVAALAIDASNLAGYSVHAIFENVRNNLPQNIEVTWSTLNVVIASGVGVAGGVTLVSIGGSLIGLTFLMISGLISVAFGMFVALVILAARQAILTILVVIAPLAFVAYVLPSTRGLFDRWRKSFTTLLVFFPLFGLLFGGSSLAGAIIMNNHGDKLHIILLGLVVQCIPLVITPLLIQFSTGLLGRIAGMANRRPGFVDNAKGWARNNAEYQKDKALGQERTLNPFKGIARGIDRSNRARENRRDSYKANADRMARGQYDRKTGEWRDRRKWVESDVMKRRSEDMQKLAQARNDTQYIEFSARNSNDPNATNPYNIREGRIRRYASKPSINGMPVLARSGDDLFNDNIGSYRDLAYDTARDIAINGIRQQQANDVRSNQHNNELKLNTDLQTIATGIGQRDIMLAGVITKERKEIAEQINAQDQLMKHFKLDSAQWQNLAVGKSDVNVSKDGLAHTFHVKNEFAREAAIEHQMAAGSVGQIRDIINEAGLHVETLDATGKVVTRPGNNYDHRTTVVDAAVKNGVAAKVPYFSDKSFDQATRGEWRGPVSESINAMRQVFEGRLKIDNMVGANDGALRVIYELGDLKNSSSSVDRGKYDYYKQELINMLSDDPTERSAIASRFDSDFDSNYEDIRKIAAKISSDDQIAQRATLNSRKIFEHYKTP